MSPSRGLRTTHTFASLLTSRLPTQIYLSLSTSPHLNLSLEHHIFTTLPPATHSLLLYTNTPSLILGRNQNPWLEVNHPAVLQRPDISLIRRRSGGGTVYHDLGNMNYSVCVPTPEFDRDMHAKMVVRALRRLGVASAAVNVRHDIVVLPEAVDAEKLEEETPQGTRKVSGSAYKLTRGRSYHHGTMLLSTDLEKVTGLLKSPADKVIRARGVGSVKSPVTNVSIGKEGFVEEVLREFQEMYGEAGVAVVEEGEVAVMEDIRKGEKELRSAEWVYGQTPKFEVDLPGVGGILVVDKGVITETDVGDVRYGGLIRRMKGRKFGGLAVQQILEALEYKDAQEWATKTVGGIEWGESFDRRLHGSETTCAKKG